MGDIEVGKCECCGKENVQLLRAYITFPLVECECHNHHSICIRCCPTCKPKVPAETTLTISVTNLRAISRLICRHQAEYETLKTEMTEFKDQYTGIDYCPAGYIPEAQKKAASSCEAMYLDD